MKLLKLHRKHEGLTGFSHDGEEYKVGEDGMLEVPEKVALHAASHGFTLTKPAPAKVEEKSARSDDVDELKAKLSTLQSQIDTLSAALKATAKAAEKK